jgi:hypothetical protein
MYDKEITTSLDKSLGYLYFMDKDHPLAGRSGKVYHHRHIASIMLGRWLKRPEIIHHIDGNRANNDPENLVVLTQRQHFFEHNQPPIPPKPIDCDTCGKPTLNKRYCSMKCCLIGRRVVDRPTKEQLTSDLLAGTWVGTGRKYGVSDNAVRKWARSYGLL